MKKLALCALLGALAFTPVVASAGLKSSPGLVTLTSSRFSGVVSDARNSADNVQYIGCQGGGTFSYCFARNAAGSSVMCSTSDAGLMAAIRGLTPNSKLEVGYHTGSCTYVWVWTQSSLAAPL